MSWALEAIEREALKRAHEQIRSEPMIFRCLGYDEDQIRAILLCLESKALILPNFTVEGIKISLEERIK